ncbi:ISPg1 transposase [Porphyromonas gingivalis]|nr:ISPg1 transposase [Porphyromonas gingivalis]
MNLRKLERIPANSGTKFVRNLLTTSVRRMLKAHRGQALSESQKQLNRMISKTRCLIERTFGSIRRWFCGGRCRYRGLAKTHTRNILEAMAYNLKRMPGLLVLQGAK